MRGLLECLSCFTDGRNKGHEDFGRCAKRAEILKDSCFEVRAFEEIVEFKAALEKENEKALKAAASQE